LPIPRDPRLIAIEKQVRQAIRDAVNQSSRKPFHWGGLCGYQQLEAIAQAVATLPENVDEAGYFRRVLSQVNRVLERNRKQAQNLAEAHQWLCRVAACLHYPPNTSSPISLTSAQVATGMDTLFDTFRPNAKAQYPQARLWSALKKRWRLHQQELLACYDVPGLPQDNLQIESLFEHLRRRQRRISGRISTCELRKFGLAQVLFQAESEVTLLEQIRHVCRADYLASAEKLIQAEHPLRFLHRLHRNPVKTITQLIKEYEELSTSNQACQSRAFLSIHTD